MELSTLNYGFGITFFVMGLVSVIGMHVLASRLRNYDNHAIANCVISQPAIIVFFVLMMLPALGFAYKDMAFTAACVMLMAGVCAYGLTKLSNRARQILSQRYY